MNNVGRRDKLPCKFFKIGRNCNAKINCYQLLEDFTEAGEFAMYISYHQLLEGPAPVEEIAVEVS